MVTEQLKFLNIVAKERESKPNIIPNVEEKLRLNYVHIQ